MTLAYVKAFLIWSVLFPFLFVFNTIKATLDYVIWMFDLPTGVWDVCISIVTATNGEVNNEDNV